ncbi:putative ribonuclease H-like domain-containing protein [Tanacetum coccineum]
MHQTKHPSCENSIPPPRSWKTTQDIIEFCGLKGIKREYRNARTPQQNGVAERKNMTLIEAARTMLADSFLPNTFWVEAVSTACYVLNRVLVTKPQNKTPYELITGKIPIISYIRPFGCHVTILNTIDHLGKFDGKSDEGFLVGYSLNSKPFRVYNLETKRVEENLHITFLENKPNVAWKGPNWLFDLDYLTDSMNYQPVRSENQANKNAGPKEANHSAGTQDNIDAGNSEMETDEAVDEGRQSGETEEVKLTDDTEVVEDKGSGDKGGNAEELVSTARPEVSTARPDIDAARQEDSVVEPRTPPTTTSIFDDEDITMAQTLIKMKEEKAKEKGVSIKDVDDSSRPARSILTLKPLLTIDPKDKGKGVLKESPVKKVKRSDLDAAQIAKDAKIARLVHEKELAEMEREREERQRQDQASVDYIASLYDEVQAKMDASEELAARLQMEEREMYTIEERSKLLAEFFERRKKLLAEERAAAVRNKPPTRTQLRSLMMTYLKHTGKYRHNQLNKKTFEEIQALYIKEQERDADFVPIGSERDEKMIDKMNKKAAGMDEEEVPEEPESTKVEVKQEGREENIRKRSEEEQLRASLKIVPDEEEEIDYEVLGTRYPIVNWESAFYHTDRYGVPHDYYRVFRANGSSRYIKTFTEMVSRFDRLDFIELHSLVMQRFSTTTPEGIDLVLWGDLRIMFEETADDDIWKNQEKWIIKSWTFYENCGVHILALEDGTEIHMLAERRYPLIRETLERMMELRLTAESEGEAVFDLLRFIQKQIDEFGGQDGSEKDL